VSTMQAVLLRAFVKLYASDFDGDDDRSPFMSGKSRSAERRAFTLLSSVCSYWRQTLSGLPRPPTGHWMKRLTERECTDLVIKPAL